MKRIVLLLVLLSLLLTGCCLKHDWMEATCTDPKSCRKCDETEGEALGHNWQDADCENPKTCERCGETEGAALGHNYGAWALSGKNEMARTCSVCNGEERSDVDRELIGKQFLTGKWVLTYLGDSSTYQWFPTFVTGIAEFRADGTGTVDTGGSIKDGSLIFNDYEDNGYYFNLVFEDNSFLNFIYDETKDILYSQFSNVPMLWERE